MRRAATAVALAALVVGVSPAAAKEGAQAHLLAPLPTHPAAGSMITVRWTVDVPGSGGKRQPFSAVGMFVTLVGANGAFARATAPQTQGPPYSVHIRVPRGGIHAVRFGLMGTSCGPSGCRPSPMFFPLR